MIDILLSTSAGLKDMLQKEENLKTQGDTT